MAVDLAGDMDEANEIKKRAQSLACAASASRISCDMDENKPRRKKSIKERDKSVNSLF